jgi:ferredoxin
LPKTQLADAVDKICATHRLYAPVRDEGEVAFRPIKPGMSLTLDYGNTHKSAKSLFFPQAETMLRYERALDRFNSITGTSLDETPTVVLGMRPCDVRGLVLFDRVFGQGANLDPYYLARRRATIVVALACTQPRTTCFCHAVGGDPYGHEGANVLMRDADDAWVLSAHSERGAAWLQALGLKQAGQEQLDRAQAIARQAHEQLSPMEPLQDLPAGLLSLFDSPVWAQIAEKCIACGTCTYLCPGCHCFNIQDRVLANGGQRLRSWDGCMYEGFTVHASGHNPRPDQASRWRQRTMHKFQYLPDNVGMYGCVGCGRCTVSCPVRLDIRQVITRLQHELAEQRQGATS